MENDVDWRAWCEPGQILTTVRNETRAWYYDPPANEDDSPNTNAAFAGNEQFSQMDVEMRAIKEFQLPESDSAEAADTRLSDEALLAAYRQTSDMGLFAQLVQRYERELYNYLRRYLGTSELAEDVFQTACLMVHLKCDQFEPGRRFRPWLYAIATNAAIDAQRREKRHKAASLERVHRSESGEEPRLMNLLTSDDPDPLSEASRLESGMWVQQAMDGLSDQMRDVVNLVYFQGLKYREAAEALNVPVGTIKSRLHAAVQKLYEIWQNTHAE